MTVSASAFQIIGEIPMSSVGLNVSAMLTVHKTKLVTAGRNALILVQELAEPRLIAMSLTTILSVPVHLDTSETHLDHVDSHQVNSDHM